MLGHRSMRRATRATRWAGTVRGSVHTLEKPLAVGQQLRTRSRPPDGLRMRRGSPEHLRKQPRRTSGAQPRGSRGVCGCIAGTGKPANAPAGHLTRRPRPGRRTRASWRTSAQARPNLKLLKKATHGAGRGPTSADSADRQNPCRAAGGLYIVPPHSVRYCIVYVYVYEILKSHTCTVLRQSGSCV